MTFSGAGLMSVGSPARGFALASKGSSSAPALRAERMTRAEEVELSAALNDCRSELLAIALLDPASRPEVERLSEEVASGARRVESVVDARGSSAEAARLGLQAFAVEVARLPSLQDHAALSAPAEERSPSLEQPALPAVVEGALGQSRALVESLPLQWDAAERVLRGSWVRHAMGRERSLGAGRGAGKAPAQVDARSARTPAAMPSGLSPRVRQLVAGVERVFARFTTAHQGLVVYVVQRYRGLGLAREDLIQEGNLGLLRAVEKFDARRGNAFASYAVWWIREAVRRALAQQARTIRMPTHVLARRQELARVARRLGGELGREPSLRELAEATGLELGTLGELWQLLREPLSLDAPRGDDTTATLSDGIADDAALDADEGAAARQSAERVRELLDSLSARERRVLELRFGLGEADEQTLEEIGRSLGLTRERVRQIVVEALGKLNRTSRRRHVEL
jgi:RNA polymerase primary sigma factor